MEKQARTAPPRVPCGDGDGAELTGAEAVALVLAQHAVETVFAYPGTSEIALCDAIARTPDLRLVPARGDKESAFMASGASLVRPNRAAAILHGARGLTNATGAVAAARRNEVGTLFVVGLPSTGSAPFLPPHGEPQLIASIGQFTQWCWEAPPPPDGPDRATAAIEFVDRLHDALTASARLPARPSLFGIPQDVAEARWVPASALRRPRRAPAARPVLAAAAVEALRLASRPLFLVDDYALRYPGVRRALAELTDLLGAPVFQVRYRRGPMLFERIRREEVGTFLGWFDQFCPAHTALLDACDLFVTVEDRNVYPRVFGPLPTCRKLAINGDAAKARKNGYLGDGDVLVDGDVTDVLRTLTSELRERRARPWFPPSAMGGEGTDGGEQASAAVEHLRTGVVAAIGATLGGWDAPVLVDDSQMFGGMISERYDLLPPGLRVFGDHGGFVGGGLATAIGLAIADPRRRVLCTLGDQGFVNSFQALVTAVQERAPIVVLVCNNGGAVSLQKQAGETARPYLRNTPALSYRRIAEAIGARTGLVSVPDDLERSAVAAAAGELRRALATAAATAGPALVELRLPADPGVWRGIWLARGFDERAPTAPGAGRRGGSA
jgi:acetolactate synthase I/II/III large subunit